MESALTCIDDMVVSVTTLVELSHSHALEVVSRAGSASNKAPKLQVIARRIMTKTQDICVRGCSTMMKTPAGRGAICQVLLLVHSVGGFGELDPLLKSFQALSDTTQVDEPALQKLFNTLTRPSPQADPSIQLDVASLLISCGKRLGTPIQTSRRVAELSKCLQTKTKGGNRKGTRDQASSVTQECSSASAYQSWKDWYRVNGITSAERVKTVCLSAKGRVSCKFDKTLEDILAESSLTLKRASQLSVWLALNSPDTLKCLKQSRGQTFFGRCLSAVSLGKANGIEKEVVDNFFSDSGLARPKTRESMVKALEPARNLMATSALKYCRDLFLPKILELAKHVIRKQFPFKLSKAEIYNKAKVVVDFCTGGKLDSIIGPRPLWFHEAVDIVDACVAPIRHAVQDQAYKRSIAHASMLKSGTFTHAVVMCLVKIGAFLERERQPFLDWNRANAHLTKEARMKAFLLQPWWWKFTPKAFSPLPLKEMGGIEYLHFSESTLQSFLKMAGDKKPLDGGVFWWKRFIQLDGKGFTCWRRKKKKKKGRKRKLQIVPGLVTIAARLEMLRMDPGKYKCPWILTGFSTNGREVHLTIKTLSPKQGGHDGGGEQRNHVQGNRELYKAGYHHVKKLPALDVTSGGQTKGVFGCVQAIDCEGGDLTGQEMERLVRKLLLLDPGQIHFVSTQSFDMETATLSRDWEALCGVDWKERAGSNILGEHDEQRRKDNPEYQTAITALGTVRRRTCVAETFTAYLRELSQHEAVLLGELNQWKRRSLAFDVRIMKQRALDRLANHMKGRGEIVFFGTGSCRGKGHSRVPVKALMRAMARVMPVVTLWEWGTSSRCPCCHNGNKMLSCKASDFQHFGEPEHLHEHDGEPEHLHEHDGEPEHLHEHDGEPEHLHEHDGVPEHLHEHDGEPEHSHEYDTTDTEEPSDVPVATPKGSNLSDSAEGGSEFSFISAEQRTDDRIEWCQDCGRLWPHDSVSMFNFAIIVWAQINGYDRPQYLTPTRWRWTQFN
jgi:hypothetical protein